MRSAAPRRPPQAAVRIWGLSCSWRSFPEGLRGCSVGRKEQLDRELGRRDLEGGVEAREHAEERPFATSRGAQLHRSEDLAADDLSRDAVLALGDRIGGHFV